MAAGLAAIACVVLSGGTAGAEVLVLPDIAAAQAADAEILAAVGARPDRRLTSVVPGPVHNEEVVLVGLAGSGQPTQVEMEQHLTLTGTGDYQVRERGPARRAVALAEEPPVTKFGAVVWQGFSPGSRKLAARLTLDPVLERPRLPMRVEASYVAANGAPAPLGPGGTVPGAGTVTVRLTNATTQPADLPTAADATARALAGVLDPALAAARRTTSGRLPTAGAGLPRTLTAVGVARVRGSVTVPLRVTGAVRVEGTTATVSGPGTTPVDGGANVTGTLQQTASVVLAVAGPGRLRLNLHAVGTLDERALTPPGGAPTWAAWATSSPAAAARRSALDLAVAVAATGARASSYSPYLGAGLPGTGSTEFRYSFAEPPQTEATTRRLEPQPAAIAVVALLSLLALGAATVIWRRS